MKNIFTTFLRSKNILYSDNTLTNQHFLLNSVKTTVMFIVSCNDHNAIKNKLNTKY